jgi:hypothetical protein
MLAIFMFPLLGLVSSLTCETTIPPRMSLFYALSASMAEPAGAPGVAELRATARHMRFRYESERLTTDLANLWPA